MNFVLGEFICFTVFETSPDPFVFTGTYEIDPKDLKIGRAVFCAWRIYLFYSILNITCPLCFFTGTYEIDPKDLKIGRAVFCAWRIYLFYSI